ncbi:MAG TPA: PQQ-binding-like beta-propeller repeat protein [Blastocatellia bacterium]|nr:PQQ-binding-like beta-propeller repeat protein [Blastocatellia bacterium]
MAVNAIYLGIKGAVVALNRATGEEIWRTALKGGDFVNVVLDGNQLYATTKGEIFCLDTTTGEPRWHNKLSGLGLGLISIATPSGSQVLTAQEKRQRDAAAAATAASAS